MQAIENIRVMHQFPGFKANVLQFAKKGNSHRCAMHTPYLGSDKLKPSDSRLSSNVQNPIPSILHR